MEMLNSFLIFSVFAIVFCGIFFILIPVAAFVFIVVAVIKGLTSNNKEDKDDEAMALQADSSTSEIATTGSVAGDMCDQQNDIAGEDSESQFS